jgi:AcrR family transcriptional regulator
VVRRTAKRRKASYHHGNLKEALVDAALAVLGERGAAKVTLREVARRTRVSQAAPYRHFANGAALLAAVAAAGFDALGRQMAARVAAAGGDPRARLQASAVGYTEFALQNEALFRLMSGTEAGPPSSHPLMEEAARRSFRVMLDELVGCQKAGLVRHGEPMDLGLGAWAMIHGMCALLLDGQLERFAIRREDGPARTLDLAELLWTGLAATPQLLSDTRVR